MKAANKFFLLLACLFSMQAAIAQKQLPPAGGTAKDFKLPQKKTKTLANGLKAVMVQYGDVPKVSIQLIIKTGNAHEAAGEVWLADLTGQMIRQGTGSTNFKALSQKAAAMGGDINVSVGPDQTYVSGSVLSEYAADFIRLIADMIMRPALPAAELERLKADMKRKLTVDKSRPQSQAAEKFYQAVYKDHPYGRYFPTEAMISAYTVQKVKDFYNKNFGAKRSVLYVAGKYDEAAVTAAVENAFGKWKAGPDVWYPPVQIAAGGDTAVLDRKSAPQTTIMVGLPVLTPKDKDYIPQVIANSLLGGSFFSRITSNIRENKGYTYSPFSSINNRQGSSLWIEQADVTSEHTADALQEIQKEIRRLQNEPPAKEEVTGIQNYEAGIFVLRNSSPFGIISQLNFLDRYGLPDSYLTNLVQNMYKVTPEKISEIAKNQFKYENMRVVMVGDKESVQKQISASGVKKGF